jgi:mycothiol S-conjugate amidase
MRPADAVVPGLVRIIRERRPQIVVTWDESGGYGHPDHVAIHHHATAAFHAAANPAMFPDAGQPWAGASLFYTAIPMEEFARLMEETRKRGIPTPEFGEDESIAALPRVPANCVIDVGPHFEQKMQAMLAHRSQITADDPFMRMPADLQRSFFGREYFHRSQPPLPDGAMLDDFFAKP